MSGPTVITLAIDDYSAAMPHGISDDDHELRTALEGRGVTVRPVIWGGAVEPGATVVVRSTWDYVDHVDRFRAWLDHLDHVGARVHNPTDTIRWNLHKGYLLDLAARGVPVVPTTVLAAGSDVPEIEGDQVVKPAIANDSRLTIHAGREGLGGTAAHLARLLQTEDVLVQPFVPSISTDGEISVVAIAGVPTHAVRKTPAAGEWRVQYSYGGQMARIDLDAELTTAAERVLAALDDRPTFARVDLARWQGAWHLMELELIEPNLFCDLAPEAAAVFADRLIAGATA